MQARVQELPFDPATLPGLSEKLLRSHHQNNYGGAVARLNAIRGQLAELAFASAPGFALNGLKREELIASNSMLLHELYFGSLGGGIGKSPELLIGFTYQKNMPAKTVHIHIRGFHRAFLDKRGSNVCFYPPIVRQGFHVPLVHNRGGNRATPTREQQQQTKNPHHSFFHSNPHPLFRGCIGMRPGTTLLTHRHS